MSTTTQPSLLSVHLRRAGVGTNNRPDRDSKAVQDKVDASNADTAFRSLPAVFEDEPEFPAQADGEHRDYTPLSSPPTTPHLSFIISKPRSAPSDQSGRLASQQSSTTPPEHIHHSKPPTVWCHRLNSQKDHASDHHPKSESNKLYNLLRSFSVSSMPALSTSATTANTATTLIEPSTPPCAQTWQRRKSSNSSLPSLPSLSSFSTTTAPPTATPKAAQSTLVDTTSATAQMIKYDAQVERKRMSLSDDAEEMRRRNTLWRRIGGYVVDTHSQTHTDSAALLNSQIRQEERFPDSLTERLRNVKARWSLSISEARSEGRAQAVALLRDARILYREMKIEGSGGVLDGDVFHSYSPSPSQSTATKSPRCDHCCALHSGGPYECDLNRQIRAGRAHEREKRRIKSWIELHLTALKLNVGNWDKINCPHPLSHIKKFEYGADLCTSSGLSSKSWLEIQGDTDRERNEALLESREFDFCLEYLAHFHRHQMKKKKNTSSYRPRSSI
ncbi:hypothetical protein E3P77_02019 [Wallemia ichthyophaga]|nr:hypothetical protein E3P97_01485 [Wallemia ichthyophaga]TIB32129.1 hypothetical protein E3P85_01986 [Wallemia ichthyophaga]TIB48021.1 hypothetical protein E3P82_01483 [Wallemia ichthyophaga]TIB52222.1 hypothetical protein E3P81_01484 [Wallemia ichthyophaga]TIB54974.1 hypothetical protein E3P80_01484 [Wallemia ichthyophaga]